jgi:hypothetical protein
VYCPECTRDGVFFSSCAYAYQRLKRDRKMLNSVDFESTGVICTYSGAVSLQDILEAVQRYLTHPNCSGFKFIVHDFSALTLFDFTEAEFESLVTYAMKHYQDADHVPRCAVTENDTVRRSLTLYAELTGRGWDFALTTADARKWASTRRYGLVPVSKVLKNLN